ncbi:unannotated protein [freshwater metagenome]|uniref:Unannotated protein n=1 Tax=freshwater metagenome TaxID=449393 RepID=A0A6J7D8C4_9ZZZZ
MLYGVTSPLPPELMSAMELVNTRPSTVEYEGDAVVLEVGDPMVHAVRGESMVAECGDAARRLLPTGWRWPAEHPIHLARCPKCLVLHPLLGVDGVDAE